MLTAAACSTAGQRYETGPAYQNNHGLYGRLTGMNAAPVIGADGPVTGAYLSGRFAARENAVSEAGAAFREVALSPIARRAGLAPHAGDDTAEAEPKDANDVAPEKDTQNDPDAQDAADTERSPTPPGVRALRQSFFYYVAAGEIENALSLAKRIEGPLPARPVADPEASTDAETIPVDDDAPPRSVVSSSDPGGLARVALGAEALKNGDFVAAMARLDLDEGDPLIASVASVAMAWAAAGQAGPVAGLAALETGDASLFKGFHPTHQAFLAEQDGQLGLAGEAYRASVFGLGGPVGRAAYGAFLERRGNDDATRAYYTFIAEQPGPDRRIAEAGLKRLEAGKVSSAFSAVTPAEGAAIALYSFGAFMLEQVAEQRADAENAGFTVGPPRYNLPLALAQLAIYLDPDLSEARRLAGLIFGVYDNHEAAIEVLKAVPPTSPHYEQARVDIAQNYMALKEDERAARILRQTIARIDKPLEAQFALANAYAAMEQPEASIAAVNVVIDALPEAPPEDAWRYFIVRGDAYLKADQWEKAEADLKRAVEIAPEEPTTLNYLGYVWAERGVNLDEAFPLIQKAVALRPTSGAIVDSLGWAYFQTGDYDSAVGHLERAAALEPADPTITEHLGDAYWRLGRTREAQFQWARALELEPADDQRRLIEEKIEDGLPPSAPKTLAPINAPADGDAEPAAPQS